MAVSYSIISEDLKNQLAEFLGFRHFFHHAYALDLHTDRIEKLVSIVQATFTEFRKEIDNCTSVGGS
jgi:hypothetical protein